MGWAVVWRKTAHTHLLVSHIILIQPGKPVLQWKTVCISVGFFVSHIFVNWPVHCALKSSLSLKLCLGTVLMFNLS